MIYLDTLFGVENVWSERVSYYLVERACLWQGLISIFDWTEYKVEVGVVNCKVVLIG